LRNVIGGEFKVTLVQHQLSALFRTSNSLKAPEFRKYCGIRKDRSL